MWGVSPSASGRLPLLKGLLSLNLGNFSGIFCTSVTNQKDVPLRSYEIQLLMRGVNAHFPSPSHKPTVTALQPWLRSSKPCYLATFAQNAIE